MKTIFILILILSNISVLFTQNNIHRICLDFKQKEFKDFEKHKSIKKGDFFQLEINGINMNLYNVLIDKKDTLILSNVSFPTFDLINIGGIADFMENLSSIAYSGIKVTNNQRTQQSQENNGNGNGSESESLFSHSDLESKLLENHSFLNLKTQELIKINQRIDNFYFKIQNKSFSYLISDTISKEYNLLSGQISVENIIKKSSKIRKDLDEFLDELFDHQNKYSDLIHSENAKKIINKEKNKELKKAQGIISKTYTDVISKTEKVLKRINSEKVSSWIRSLILKEENRGDFTYRSLPLQFNGNQSELNIRIVPKSKDLGLQTYETNIQLTERNLFFVGVGMSFYYAGFKNDIFSTKAFAINDSMFNYRLINEKNKKGEFGLVTLIHFGYRPFYKCKESDWLAINLVTGPALSISTSIKPRLAIGAGLSFGRNNLLSINALYMGGQVKKRSEVFDIDEIYVSQPQNITVSKLQGAWGVSLGYIYKF